MRRIAVIVALGALLGMLGGVVTAAPALAGGRGDGWQVFQPIPPGGVPLAGFCVFPVLLTVPATKEFAKSLNLPDGSVVTQITGALRVSWTNMDTGNTITENESGPAQITTFADGSMTMVEHGRNGPVLMPADAQRFGLPPISETAGQLTMSLAPDGSITSLTLHGQVLLDVCAALS